MQVARVRSMLWLTAALAVAGAVAAILAAAMLPLSTSGDSSSSAVTTARRSTTLPATHPSTVPPLASFEPAWRLRLRRPLVDPAPAPRGAVAKVAKATRPPSLPVRLIGTIVDGEHPRGLFITGLATVELKGIGDVTGGAKILAIDENTATLSSGGESFVLKRERAPFDPSGANYDAALRLNSSTIVNPKADADEGS
ncbi:MAG: hypothetical protein JWN40_2436 [Phycisphaerales bacterium]|nr:hypothetical protein [Phycisphaerales bacterium]